MTEHLQHTAERRQPHGHFSEGLNDRPRYPEGRARRPVQQGSGAPSARREKDRHGRFSLAEEELPGDDPEKHVERGFSEGLERESA
jgi:hypothetical protein